MMKLPAPSSKSGFTLLEIVVSASVLAIAGLALSALVIQSLNGWSRGTSRYVADNSAAQAVQKLYEDVRLGSSASVDDGRLAVTVPTLVTDSKGEQYYDPSVGGTVYTYYLSNGNMYRRIGAAAGTVFARDITSFSFSINTRGNMVSVTARGRGQAGTQQTKADSDVTAQIVLRNFSS